MSEKSASFTLGSIYYYMIYGKAPYQLDKIEDVEYVKYQKLFFPEYVPITAE